MSGMRFVNGYPGEVPPRTGLALGDSLAALFALTGVLMALHNRSINGGRGQIVDVSILESCIAVLDAIIPEYGALGVVRAPTGSRMGHGAPSNVYRTLDGKWLIVAANSQPMFRRLCQVMERPDLADDDRVRDNWARVANVEELDEIVAEWVQQHAALDAFQALDDAGVVAGPINSIADVFEDPHIKFRDALVEVDDAEVGPLVHPGIIPKLSLTPGMIRQSGSWKIGADNEDVYRSLLGLTPTDLAELHAGGIV
jgi:formyl-CoA transferase